MPLSVFFGMPAHGATMALGVGSNRCEGDMECPSEARATRFRVCSRGAGPASKW